MQVNAHILEWDFRRPIDSDVVVHGIRNRVAVCGVWIIYLEALFVLICG